MVTLTEIYKIFKKTKGVCIDSRKIQDQYMFFAFKGEHTDGHQYVESVIQNESCYAVVEDENFVFNDRCLLVENVLATIQELALLYRSSFSVPVIGLTGSNGKTTTKELIHAVLCTQYKVHATQGNYNNHLGVPLTLLSAPEDAEILLIEMGANKRGDIDELCRIAAPNMGLITNIGKAHLEGFGSVQGIIDTKTELYRFVETMDGILFINKADTILNKYLPQSIHNVPYPEDDVIIEDKGLLLTIQHEGQSYNTQMYGIYNAANMQAAIAIGKYFNIEKKTSVQAIASYLPELNRSQVINHVDMTIIMDAYNANPSSMQKSIESLSKIEDGRTKIAILGDMLELGEDEVLFHNQILDLANSLNIDRVITIGSRFKNVAKHEKFENFMNSDDFITAFDSKLDIFKNSIILLKGSRSMKLENLVPFLKTS